MCLYSKNNLILPRFDNATLNLLKSSILVGLSGIFRVYIAYLLLQTHTSLLTCVAGGLIIYSVYTLDRTLESTEDTINRTELNESKKEIGFAASLLAFLIGSWIFAKEGILLFAFLPFFIGYLYSKGLKIGKHSLKLKGGLGVKNLVTGITWGLSIVGVAGHYCKTLLPVVIVFMYFCTKLFINSTIYDFKDIKGDMIAGIKTLPVSLGDKTTRDVLLLLHIVSHVILSITILIGVLGFEPIILIYSFINGLVCILYYATNSNEESMFKKLKRTVIVDGESTVIVGLLFMATLH